MNTELEKIDDGLKDAQDYMGIMNRQTVDITFNHKEVELLRKIIAERLYENSNRGKFKSSFSKTPR